VNSNFMRMTYVSFSHEIQCFRFFYLTRLKGEHLPSLGVRRPS